ncbi:MAG: DUF2529 family protein [Spirochaetales bacterium]|nr:DUF2529 family protein [Spirochaetales bacterium]
MDNVNRYLDFVHAKIFTVEEQLDVIAAAASITADRIIGGGTLYGYGDEEGFESELCSRSGGLMGIQRISESDEVGQGDAVIASTQGHDVSAQTERLNSYRENGAYVVLIGGDETALRLSADAFISTGLPVGTAPVIPYKGRLTCPTAGVIDITAMWVFVLEYTSACIRRGKMPVFWKSVCVPAGMGWIEKYAEQVFHASGEFEIPPVPEKELASTYLANLHRCLAGIRSTELEKIRETGELAARSIQSGGTVYCDAIGHHMHSQRGIDGDPGFFVMGFPESDEKAGPFKKGDYYIYNGYYVYPADLLEAVREADIRSTWIMGGNEVDSVCPHNGELHVDAYWRYGDASVRIPGYGVKVAPASGVVMTATLWVWHAAVIDALG